MYLHCSRENRRCYRFVLGQSVYKYYFFTRFTLVVGYNFQVYRSCCNAQTFRAFVSQNRDILNLARPKSVIRPICFPKTVVVLLLLTLECAPTYHRNQRSGLGFNSSWPCILKCYCIIITIIGALSLPSCWIRVPMTSISLRRWDLFGFRARAFRCGNRKTKPKQFFCFLNDFYTIVVIVVIIIFMIWRGASWQNNSVMNVTCTQVRRAKQS
jgi:hypothetical protein